MNYNEWVKFGAVRGIVGALVATFVILMTVTGLVELSSVLIGIIISLVVLAGLYGLYAYILGDFLAENNIVGWRALGIIALLVGMTSAAIVLAVPYAPAEMASPGIAATHSYEFRQMFVNTSIEYMGYASIAQSVMEKDVVGIIVISIIGELMLAFFTAGLYRMFGAKLPEVRE